MVQNCFRYSAGIPENTRILLTYQLKTGRSSRMPFIVLWKMTPALQRQKVKYENIYVLSGMIMAIFGMLLGCSGT